MSKVDEKYRLYSLSVQNPDDELDIIEETYRKMTRRRLTTLREDFCGTFLNSATWVQRHRDNVAIGLDIDAEPIGYGIRNHLPQLTADEQKRLHIHASNVLTAKTVKVEAICALNFSYYCFHQRATLLKYFQACYRSLKTSGILVLDCFGGIDTQMPRVDEYNFTEHRFKYQWQLKAFDYVNQHAMYAIHFLPKGKKPMRNAFTYHWRMWSIPELKDLLIEAGFKDPQVLVEGTTRRGFGNGKYRATNGSTETCETWVAYIIGQKT